MNSNANKKHYFIECPNCIFLSYKKIGSLYIKNKEQLMKVDLMKVRGLKTTICRIFEFTPKEAISIYYLALSYLLKLGVY